MTLNSTACNTSAKRAASADVGARSPADTVTHLDRGARANWYASANRGREIDLSAMTATRLTAGDDSVVVGNGLKQETRAAEFVLATGVATAYCRVMPKMFQGSGLPFGLV
jgi:hypothetical protein